VIGLVVVALLPRYPFPTTEHMAPAFFTANGAHAIPGGAVVLAAPYPNVSHPEPMLRQVEAGMRFKLVGGYFTGPDAAGKSSNVPAPSATYTAMTSVEAGAMVNLDVATRNAMVDDLRGWRVECIAIGPATAHDRYVTLFTELLGTPPQTSDGVDLWCGVPRLLGSG
jgi:hypothetical protein